MSPPPAPPSASSADADLAALRERLYHDTPATVARLQQHLSDLRAAPAPPDSAALARALELLSIGQRILGDYEPALRAHAESLALFESLGDSAGIAKACILGGNLHWCLGAYDTALPLYQRSLALRRALGDRRGEAGALGSIGVVLDDLGRRPEALACYEQSLAISRELGDRMFTARTLNNLGETLLALGDTPAALGHCTEALALFTALDEPAEQANTHANLGRIHRAARDWSRAREHFEAAHAAALQAGDQRAATESLMFLGALEADPATPFHSPAAARARLESALAQARALQTRPLELSLERELASACAAAGDPAAALAHHRRFHELHVATFNEKSDRRLLHLQVTFALDQARHATAAERAKAEALAAANRDLAAQKRELDEAVRRLLRLDREKNQLLGTAAHEIKNPLAGIMGLAEDWLDTHPPPPPEDPLPLIRETTERLLGLITQLLDVSALDSGSRPPLAVPVDIVDLLRRTAADHRPRADRKKIRLALDLPAGPLHATADPIALRQVLENLVSNALKFTPSAGAVTLSAASTSDGVTVSVADTGPGFTAADRSRLFQRFARLSAQPTAGEHSSGLGLFITRGLVDSMHGRLECDSTPGHGAAFRVTLPPYPP